MASGQPKKEAIAEDRLRLLSLRAAGHEPERIYVDELEAFDVIVAHGKRPEIELIPCVRVLTGAGLVEDLDSDVRPSSGDLVLWYRYVPLTDEQSEVYGHGEPVWGLRGGLVGSRPIEDTEFARAYWAARMDDEVRDRGRRDDKEKPTEDQSAGSEPNAANGKGALDG